MEPFKKFTLYNENEMTTTSTDATPELVKQQTPTIREKYNRKIYNQAIDDAIGTTKEITPMEKQQTPLQKLITIAKNTIIIDNPSSNNYTTGHNLVLSYMIAKAESLLPEEKQMVIDAVKEGIYYGGSESTGEQYFNETYEKDTTH